jgi:23S rRNA (cytosine1962-C5)-methyltransferase
VSKPSHRSRSGFQRRPRPDNRHPAAKRREKEGRFPLDPALLVQRDLVPEQSELPVVAIRSETKHPTVYRKRIGHVDPQARHGDMVQVCTEDGAVQGYGLWNPRAEAAIRILSWNTPPTTLDWWEDRLNQAVHLRRQLHLADTSNAYRIIHAEGDGFPGLAVDRYGDTLSLEAFTLGMYQRAEAIARILCRTLHLKHWIVRPGPQTLTQEGFLADSFGSPHVPHTIQIEEQGTQFEISPAEGHKTGFFCDQRDNRRRLRDFCQGKSVLDLCCYSGGFAINAALAGASQVTAVDLDEEAIQMARRNAQLNKAQVKFVHADAFAYMRDMQRNGKTFDVVVLDPPKLIHGRDDMVDGQSRYFDLNKLAAPLVHASGILVTCSCSGLMPMEDFTRTVRAACGDRRPQLLARTGAGADHPVALSCLESEYLKCLWLRMD